MRKTALKAQPIKCKNMFDIWAQEPRVASKAWVEGPKKPREEVRREEKPAEDVSLESLQERGIVEVYEPLKVKGPEDLEKAPEDVDFFIMGKGEDFFTEDPILEKLVSLDKPILAEWDSWGYSWFGRFSKFRLDQFSGSKYYHTMGIDDLKSLLRAIRAWKYLRTMRVIYIGDIPPHGVVSSKKSSDFQYLKERFGTDFVKLEFKDYMDRVKGTDDKDAEKLAKKWRNKYTIIDERNEKLEFYAKIYLGLKSLLSKYNANAITIDCSWLPNIEYVPCFAFSLLSDEGIAAGCEGDIPALYAMASILGASGEPVMMGNLNNNATHEDIENNIITVNHDVIPPSMGCSECGLKLRDFHATEKGLTPYVDLERNVPVTIAGVHWDMNKIWTTGGTIQWSEDTTHCRITVGTKIEKAKEMHKSSFGHHVVMAYGDHTKEIDILAELLEIKHVSL